MSKILTGTSGHKRFQDDLSVSFSYLLTKFHGNSIPASKYYRTTADMGIKICLYIRLNYSADKILKQLYGMKSKRMVPAIEKTRNQHNCTKSMTQGRDELSRTGQGNLIRSHAVYEYIPCLSSAAFNRTKNCTDETCKILNW